MRPEDGKRFSEIMYEMAETIQGAMITERGLRVRFKALMDFSIEDIEEAANRLLKTHKFNSMPNVAEFVDAINEASGKIPLEDKAEIEAGKVLSHLRRYGAATSPRFDDPVTRELMNGQWRYGAWARNVLESDLPWWRKDFVRAYKAHSSLGMIENSLLQNLAKVTVKSIPSGRRATA